MAKTVHTLVQDHPGELWHHAQCSVARGIVRSSGYYLQQVQSPFDWPIAPTLIASDCRELFEGFIIPPPSGNRAKHW